MDCRKQKLKLEEVSEPETKKQELIEQSNVQVAKNSRSDSSESDMDDLMVWEDESDEYSDAEERKRDFLKFQKQSKDSRGFDVDYFPKFHVMGMLIPVDDADKSERVRHLTKEAIKSYNNRTGAKYRFRRVVRATGYPCQGMVYNITFVAKEVEEGDSVDEGEAKEVEEGDSVVEEAKEAIEGNSSGEAKEVEVGAKMFEASVYREVPSANIEVDYVELKEVQVM